MTCKCIIVIFFGADEGICHYYGALHAAEIISRYFNCTGVFFV